MRSGIFSILCFNQKKSLKNGYNNLTKSIKIKKVNAIFINSKNCKTSHPQRLSLNLNVKLDLRGSNKVLLCHIVAFTTHGKMLKAPNKNYKFRALTKTWNDKFELRDGSFSVTDIQDYFECLIKKHETFC